MMDWQGLRLFFASIVLTLLSWWSRIYAGKDHQPDSAVLRGIFEQSAAQLARQKVNESSASPSGGKGQRSAKKRARDKAAKEATEEMMTQTEIFTQGMLARVVCQEQTKYFLAAFGKWNELRAETFLHDYCALALAKPTQESAESPAQGGARKGRRKNRN